MSANYEVPRSGSGRGGMPLDAARSAFEWLVAGPHPVSLDGRLFPGLPPRRMPLDEVRSRLLRRHCPQAVRDAVWAHLVLRARTDGGTWTVGAVGVALPALTAAAATLSARFAADPSDIHAAVLTGFVAELGDIDLRKPRIMLRLRWAAYRAGHAAVREALDAPVPSGHGFRSAIPPAPWGHPDFVLARAVAENAITAAEAELIGATRLEGVPLATAATERGLSYQATKKGRQRAERRLVAYLTAAAVDAPPIGPGEPDLAMQVADATTVTTTATASHRSRSAADRRRRTARKARARLSPPGLDRGVQGCGSRPRTPANPLSTGQPERLSGSTPGVPRCT